MSDLDFDEMEFFSVNPDQINSRNEKPKWIISTKKYGTFFPLVGFTNLGGYYLGFGNFIPKEDYYIQSSINYTDRDNIFGNINIIGNDYSVNIEKDSYDSAVIQNGSNKLQNNNSDIIITETGIEYNYNTPYNDCTDFTFSTIYKDIDIRDKNDNAVTTGTFNGNSYNIGHNGRSDHIIAGIGGNLDQDNRTFFDEYNFFPKEGDRRNLNIIQYLDIDNSPNFTHLSASYQTVYNLSAKNVLAIDLNYQQLFDNYPTFMSLSLGGVNSIRGYQDGTLATAEKIFQGSIEYRFPIKDSKKLKLWGHIFIDYGTDLDSQKDVPGQIGQVLGKDGEGSGYGIGLVGMLFKENKETQKYYPTLPAPLRMDLGKANGENKLQWHLDFSQHDLIL